MKFNDLPHNTFSNDTPLGDDVCNDSISVECPPPVDACSQRAAKRDNAHQRHTTSVQSSSSAESSFFPSPSCIRTRLATQEASYSRNIVHILCPVVVVASSPPSEPKLAVLQRFNSTCCQSCAQPAHLRYAVLGLLSFSAERPSPSSQSSQPPGIARLDFPLP